MNLKCKRSALDVSWSLAGVLLRVPEHPPTYYCLFDH